MSKISVAKFLSTLNIKTKDFELYNEAFTHPSFANEQKASHSYQRLEFLGDAILEAFTSEYVYKLYPDLDEGGMTIIRANAVSGSTLATFARQIKLDKQMRFGNKLESLKDSDKILADAFEALIAAIYLDGGRLMLEAFLDKNVFALVRSSKNKELKNPKTILQEFLQSSSREIIEYDVKPLEKGFEAVVLHDGHIFGKGRGATKNEAEVQAAENSLKLLKIIK